MRKDKEFDNLIDSLEFDNIEENFKPEIKENISEADLYNYLKDFFEKITTSVDVEATINIIVDVISDYLYPEACVIINEKNEHIVERNLKPEFSKHIEDLYRADILGWVKNEQKQTVHNTGDYSIIVFPMYVEADFRGFFILFFKEFEIKQNFLNFLNISSYILAIFIAKLKLYKNLVEKSDNLEIKMNEARDLYEELLIVYDFVKSIGSVFDEKELYRLLIRMCKKALGANKAYVLIFERKSHHINVVVGEDGNASEGKKVPVMDFLKDFTNNPKLLNIKENISDFMKKTFGLNSIFVAPIMFEEKLHGIILLSERETNKPYSERDEKTFSSFAQQTSNSLENIKLHNQFIEKQKMERDLELARNIQESLLPSRPPVIDNLQIAAVSIPAKQVGGDYYDFYKENEHECWFLIGDVSGKGMAAAILMAMIRSLFRSELKNSDENTGDLLTNINDLIVSDIYEGKFITFVAAYVNSQTGKMYFTNAGHVPFIVYKARQNEIMEFEADNLPVGIMENVKYVTKSMKIDEGDIVFFYTDGINEAMNSEREEFGIDRLKESIIKNKNKSAGEILKSVLEDVDAFAGKQPQHDDTTVIVLKKATRKFNSIKENIVLESSISSVNKFVDKVVSHMNELEIYEDEIFDVKLALSELLINAAKHGNKFDLSKKIYVDYYLSLEKLDVIVEDEGDGFDNSFLKDYDNRLMEENGRGIILVSSISDRFVYNNKGNKVEMTRFFKGFEA